MDIDPTLIDPALAGSSSSSPTPNGTSKAHSSTKSNPESKMPLSNTHSHNNQDDDDDPIVATFNILLKPTLPANRRVLILEHPNKSDGRKPARSPMELRVKPATGMVEVDFPIDYNTAYDRTKGLNWGTNLHKNIEAKKGGSHGLAGGFGVGAPPPRAARAGGRGANDDEIFDMGMDWSEALRKDYVLRTQTLGGQTPDVSAESKYMVGVFTGSNLHLTPASSLVHLRPQLHHIDATAEQERLARGGAAGGAGGAGAAGGNKEAARAIHMTIKQTKDGGDELIQETMADRLKRVQTENWRRMRYVHEEAMDSWAVSEEALYLRGPTASSVPAGKQVEGAEGADADANKQHGLAELAEQVAALRTGMDEDDMLEKTSGIVKAKPATVKMEISDDEPSTSAAATSNKARTEKGKAAAAPAARRGKKAPATTSTISNSNSNSDNTTGGDGDTANVRASTSTGQ